MEKTDPKKTGNSLGRPRSSDSHDAALRSALKLVTKRGYRDVSVNEIAADAGIGKMTIYRHWTNKAALVMDALLELIGDETAFPEEGAAVERLRLQLLLQAAFFRGRRGTLIRSLVAEAQSDSQLAEAFRSRWLEPRRDGVRRIMSAAVQEGSLRADLDVEAAIDSLYGALYYRLLLGSADLDESFINKLYQQFLIGHGYPTVTAGPK